MIRVEVFYDESVIKGFTIYGHANMASPGEDLVCASVSALGQTALLGLDDYLDSKPRWRIDDAGYLECWLPEDLTEDEFHAAQVIIHTMELGLVAIGKTYGQYLKVSKRRWIKCCSK